MPPNQFWYCTMLVIIVLAAVLCSSLLLVSMTFERFYSTIRPHKAASFNTVKRARATVLCIFTFSFLYYLPICLSVLIMEEYVFPNKIASGNVYGELYYWFSEVISVLFPFVSLLSRNSIIIHTLRQRGKLNLTGTEGQGHMEGQNKNPDQQIFTILLLVTFGYLVLTTPVKLLVFYLNFYSGNTPYYYAGLHLFYQIGEKIYYTNNGINFIFYVMSGRKIPNRLKETIFFP